MNPQENNKPSVTKIYKQAFSLLKTNPALLIPFVTFTIIDSFVLTIIFLSPRKPFLSVLGPPISTIWGERFLHYPYNFLLLPKLAAFSKMGLSVVFASILTAMAVAMVFDLFNKKPVSLAKSFKSAFKKYIFLFTIVFIFTALLYIIVRTINTGLISYFLYKHHNLPFFNPNVWLGPLLLCLNFFVAVFIQGAFIYAIPLIIIKGVKFTKSIAQSLSLFKSLFIPTILLVGLPMLIYIPIIVLNYNTVFLIQRFFPEIILIIGYFGIIVSSLIIDPVITISATLLFLETRKNSV